MANVADGGPTAQDVAALPYGLRPVPPPADMSDVERLLAYEEIRQLWARFLMAQEARDLETGASLFVDDYVTWKGDVGREALLNELESAFAQLKSGIVTFHVPGHQVVNLLDRDHAQGTVSSMAEFGDRERWIFQRIVYDNTYERRDGTWYIANTQHHLVYGTETDLRPLDLPPADWPRNVTGLGSAPYCWQTWRDWYARVMPGPSPLARLAPPWRA